MNKSITNILEVESLIENFLKENDQGIRTIHKMFYKTSDELSLRALVSEVSEKLKDGCVTYLNKKYPIEEINSYLFYIVNAHCKENAVVSYKKQTEYLCPGCLFLGKENLLINNKFFNCNECSESSKRELNLKKKFLFTTFAFHNKNGYRCKDCNRFIPHPLDGSNTIKCPYLDCCFVGDLDDLKKMHHPNVQSKVEHLILDSSKDSSRSFKDNLVNNELNALEKLEIQEDYEQKISLLREVIESQLNTLVYNSANFTLKHKQFVYQAFLNLLQSSPIEMTEYLLGPENGSPLHRGFQHKVFQEYILLLEKNLPFSYKKGNTVYSISSLLDEELNLFDGISTFNGIVTEKLEIKNNTQEYYIGGRKATYSKPYYIGKLLNIIDKKTSLPILDCVVEYSFSRIKMKNVKPETEVIVSHLRVPPHYQMGGMVYVNRIKKKITDRALYLLKENNHET
jgi:hypothetical protein